MLRRSRILTAGVIMALSVAPGSAVAMPDQPVPPSSVAQDLRSPDARDAATQAAETPQVAQDLRSPDARDAAVQAAEPRRRWRRICARLTRRDAAIQAAKPTPQVAQDLRSPDARDAAVQAAKPTPTRWRRICAPRTRVTPAGSPSGVAAGRRDPRGSLERLRLGRRGHRRRRHPRDVQHRGRSDAAARLTPAPARDSAGSLSRWPVTAQTSGIEGRRRRRRPSPVSRNRESDGTFGSDSQERG